VTGRRDPDVARPPRSAPRLWLSRVVTTLSAWLVAFLAVLALLTVLGDRLTSLPLAVRALVISGVLVALMVNLVMPVLGRLVTRWMPGMPPTRRPRRG
jgi:antibiotic biosynthesis monooxygenase (ABM) superfamily enzyme